MHAPPITRQLTSDELNRADLEGLEIFSRFRRHRQFSEQELLRVFRGQLGEKLRQGGACFALYLGEKLVSVCAVSPLAWESGHFGLPMAGLQVAAAAGVPNEELTAFFQLVLDQALELTGSRHISTDIDIDDYPCLNALLVNGFEILDIKRTYCASRLRADIDCLRGRGRVRPYAPSDIEPVMALVEHTDFATRFTRDRFLLPERAKEMYRQWFSRLLQAGDDAVLIRVHERQGRVVACGAIDQLDLRRYGVDRRFMSGGLYASGPEGVGGYIPVMHDLTTEAARRHGLVETTVSLNNPAACRVLESFRSYSGSVVRYALRRYLPG